MIVDRNGETTDAAAQQTVAALFSKTQPETLQRLVSDLSSLSDVPLYKDNQVELLIDGPATYKSMLKAISEAKRYVYLETYIFADDDAGKQFADLLTKKCKDNVIVKVVYDSFGSISSDAEFFADMEAAGIQLIEFNNVDPIQGGNPLKLNNRNHRKLLVVDGEVAYTGGINLSSTYSSRSSAKARRDPLREGWRDTHIAVRGPAVEGFAQLFAVQWRALGGELEEPSPSHVKHAQGRELVAILTAQGGDGRNSAIFAGYVDAMKVARERIWITQAYFAPDKEFLDLLRQSAKRGVDVQILVPGLSDSQMVLNASRSKYSNLLRSGVRIYESEHTLLHAKTAVIDGVWSTVGSSNLDYRSFLHNDEINAIILGEDFAETMETQFLKDTRQAREITLAAWKKRSVWARLHEKMSWVVEYWL
jgi:cardiolipin synthase